MDSLEFFRKKQTTRVKFNMISQSWILKFPYYKTVIKLEELDAGDTLKWRKEILIKKSEN